MTDSLTTLNEDIRLYIRACYISEELGPGGTSLDGELSTVAKTPEFGEISSKELAKQARKHARQESRQASNTTRYTSLYRGGLHFSPAELARLRSRALQALGHARKQLGASAHYCGAMIRLEDDCDGLCKDNPIYKEINKGEE